jgi:hypothetical protein
MSFIKEPSSGFCDIERSSLYRKLSNYSVKTVEYIKIRNLNNTERALAWIEAKTSFLISSASFDNAIDEVAEKFAHSLELFASIMMDKLSDDEFEFDKFRHIYKTARFQMVLVIKIHETRRLSEVKNALKHKLRRLCKIWHLEANRDILVLGLD